MAKDGMLLAPPRSNLILEGIRYGFLEELAHDAGIAFNARPISQQEVDGTDQLMLSSATTEPFPITTYNRKPVGQGQPAPAHAASPSGTDKPITALHPLCPPPYSSSSPPTPATIPPQPH